MANFQHLQDRLEAIDRQLASCRGPATPEQRDLLRLRREIVMTMADERRALWGDETRNPATN